MQYITGIAAFGIECERDSVGKWNIGKKDWLDDNFLWLSESDDSPFKNYGIEENKIVPYREYCTYNVADHVRAYLDLLHAQKFDLLDGAFHEYIRSMKCRKDIFMVTYGKLRHLAGFHAINDFMCNEFGNAWMSYVDSVETVAEHLANREDIQTLDETLTKRNYDVEENFKKRLDIRLKQEKEDNPLAYKSK
jgi:hypothetical protein